MNNEFNMSKYSKTLLIVNKKPVVLPEIE